MGILGLNAQIHRFNLLCHSFEGTDGNLYCALISVSYGMLHNSLAISPYSRAFHPSILFGFALCGSYGSVTGVLRLHVYIDVTIVIFFWGWGHFGYWGIVSIVLKITDIAIFQGYALLHTHLTYNIHKYYLNIMFKRP